MKLNFSSGIYKCTFTHKKLGIPKEHLAGKSLPHLVSLSIDNNLNLNQVDNTHSFLHRNLDFSCSATEYKLSSVSLQIICVHTQIYFCKLFFVSGVFQFNSFMAVIKDMLSRMEAEHKTKLEQLHIMQEQQRYPFN